MKSAYWPDPAAGSLDDECFEGRSALFRSYFPGAATRDALRDIAPRELFPVSVMRPLCKAHRARVLL